MKRNVLKKRTLRLEQLENRELLSATTWNDAAQADAALAAEMAAVLNADAPIDLTAAFSAAEVETTAEEAQTWFVTSNLDDGGEGTLRKIIEKAQAGDTIKFDPSLKGATITLTQGEIAIDKDLTIDAYDLYRFEDLEGLIHDQDHTGLTIDANFVDRVFNIAEWTDEEFENATDQKIELKIIGVHMTNGSLHNNVDNYVHGGAIHVPAHGALTLEMCVISNSTAIKGGGAIAVSGELRASDTIFENNNGGEDHGGAIRVFDGFVEVIDCYFRNNVIRMVDGDYYSGGGGAVSATGGVFRSFNTLYTGNCASFGGAFFVGGGEVYLSNSLVVENGAIRDDDVCSDGGGVNVDSGSLTIVNSTIAGNKITGNSWYKRGAGLFANADAGSLTVYIYNSIIAENSYLNNGSWEVGLDVTINEPWGWGSNKKVVNMYGWNNLSPFADWEGESSGNLTYDGSEPLFAEANGLKYALAEGSRAIDGGKAEYAKDYYGRSIEADFIRYKRVAGARIDIGALEYASTPYYEAIARPENVRFSDYNLDAKTVVVSWDDKSYNELGFRVEISTDGKNWSWVAQTAENVASTTLTGIEPNTPYYVRVRAEIELSNVSEWSDAADFTAVVYTLDEPAVSAEATSATEIAFYVGKVENAVGYVYEYSANPDFSNATRGELATSGMLTISGLQPYTRYYFRAYAVGTGLYLDSPWNSTYATTEKAVLVAPTPGVALTDEETTLELSFDAVPNATSYVYRYSTNPDFTDATVVTTTEAGAFEIAGLEPGETYYFQTKAIGGGAYVDSDWSNPIAATTSAIDLPAPNVSADATGSTTIEVTVDPVPNATTYYYRYATTEEGLETAEPIELDGPGAFEISGLDPNATYYVQVYAAGDGEAYEDSVWSTPVSATTEQVKLAPPSVSGTPVDFSTLKFEIGYVANADSYIYEYSTSPDFANATTGRTALRTVDVSGLNPYTTYYFRAKAVGTGAYETSEWSETASATTPKFDLAAPAIETVATSSSEIELTIGAVERATGYYYEYSTDPNFGNVLSGMTSAGTVKISALEPHTKYYFRVLAYGGPTANISAWSTDDATTLQAKLTPPTPTLEIVKGTGYFSSDKVRFAFDAVPNATKYVYRYSTDSKFASNVTTEETTSVGPFDFTNFKSGQTYYFQVMAVGDGDRYEDSDWSNVVSATTSKVHLPAPPVAIQTVGSTTLSFNFDAVANASSYEYRYATTEDGLETATAKSASAAGTFELTGLNPVTTYYIQVRAIGNNTNYVTSEWSTAVDATTVKIVLDAPEVDAATVDSSTLTFEIGAVENASHYVYEYSTSRYFTAETTVSGTTTSAGAFDVDGLSPFTTYYFRAKAVVDAASPKAETHESSAWSTEAFATTEKAALSAPEISAVALDPTTLALTISPVANAAGYEYLMSTDPDFADAKEIGSGSGTILITDLAPNTTYYFKAKAKADANGAYVDSDWSEPSSATTPRVQLIAPEISAQGTSDSTISVAIGEVAYASGYIYEYSENADFSDAKQVKVETAGTYPVEGLQALTTYYFRVKAVGGDAAIDSDYGQTSAKTWEVASTIVTIDGDVEDPTDNEISLREAIKYAEPGESVTFDYAELRDKTIVLVDDLTITKDVTIDAEALYHFNTNVNSEIRDADATALTVDGAGNFDVNVAEDVALKIVGVRFDAVDFDVDGELTLFDCVVADGGVDVAGENASFDATHVIFEDAEIAVSVSNGATATIVDSFFDANETAVSVVDSTLTGSGNRYADGTSEDGAVVLTNSTAYLANEVVVDNAAGLSVVGGELILVNSTVVGNGVAILLDGASFTAANSILVENGVDVQATDSAMSASNVLTTFDGWTNASANVAYDGDAASLFVDWAARDLRLAAGSVAIDAGNTELAVDASGAPLAKDFVGAIRVTGSSVDLGAIESSSSTYFGLGTPVLRLGLLDVETKLLPMNWTAVDGATRYRVEGSSDGVNFWFSGYFEGTEREALINYPDSKYVFRVRAEVTAGAEAELVSDWTYATYAPGAPGTPGEILFDNYDATTGMADMSWGAAAGATRYRVEYAIGETTDPADFAFSEVTPGDTERLANVGKNGGYVTSFRVRAENNGGVSDWVYGTYVPSAPAVPGEISFGAYDAATGMAEMSWGAAAGATCYRVEYAIGETTDPADFAFSEMTLGDTERLANVGKNGGYVRSFRVRAENNVGVSDWVYGTYVPAIPEIPTGPTAVAFDSFDATNGKLTMSWTGVSETATRIRVEFSVDNGATWNHSQTLPSDATGRVATIQGKQTTYQFRVCAINAANVDAPESWAWTYSDMFKASEWTGPVSNAVSEAFADLFADDSEDDFWFELENALGKRSK